MPQSQARVGGSGYTRFSWRGRTLAWAQTLQDTAPTPVAAATAVQPLDAETPKEIVLPRAVGAGTLRITLYELWNGPVWQQLNTEGGTGSGDFSGIFNILDIFKKQLSMNAVTCSKIIKRPSGGDLVYTYKNCVITDVDDSESITLNTTTLPKSLTIMYTSRVVK